MHSKSDNIEIMFNDEADEIMKELFDSLISRYQNNLESVKGSKFLFDYVQLLYYKRHKINPNNQKQVFLLMISNRGCKRSKFKGRGC